MSEAARSGNDPDTMLELRLMHEWTAYVCQTFSTAWEFWKYQAPLIAFEHRYVMDSLLALSALHASRQRPMQWMPLEGRMVPLRDPRFNSPAMEDLEPSGWKLDNYRKHIAGLDGSQKKCALQPADSGNQLYLATKRHFEMLQVSRMYFDRAIDGQRRALAHINIENIEAIYVTSIVVSFNALFTLSESEDDPTLPAVDPIQWLRLAASTRLITDKWREFVGPTWLRQSGVFYGKPDMSDEEELFRREHGRPFEKLLFWGSEYESISDEDRDAYQKALSYIGLIYKGIDEDFDHPLATCRRLIAMPSRLPRRWVELVEQRQPRAIVMLAHVFAIMKLVDKKTEWFRGVAERQVPALYETLPNAWKDMMTWPMQVAHGEVDAKPRETEADIGDILRL